MDYVAFLRKESASDCGVSFPDFPGCVTAGRTLEEARRMAVEALAHSRGGRYTIDNIVPACGSINTSKCNGDGDGLRQKRLNECDFLLRYSQIKTALAVPLSVTGDRM